MHGSTSVLVQVITEERDRHRHTLLTAGVVHERLKSALQHLEKLRGRDLPVEALLDIAVVGGQVSQSIELLESLKETTER